MLEQVRKAPDAAAVLNEVCKLAERWGNPSVVYPWSMRGEQAKRLLIDMIVLAEGDSDLAAFLKAYRTANRIECRGHSYDDEDIAGLDDAVFEMDSAAEALKERFELATAYIRQGPEV